MTTTTLDASVSQDPDFKGESENTTKIPLLIIDGFVSVLLPAGLFLLIDPFLSLEMGAAFEPFIFFSQALLAALLWVGLVQGGFLDDTHPSKRLVLLAGFAVVVGVLQSAWGIRFRLPPRGTPLLVSCAPLILHLAFAGYYAIARHRMTLRPRGVFALSAFLSVGAVFLASLEMGFRLWLVLSREAVSLETQLTQDKAESVQNHQRGQALKGWSTELDPLLGWKSKAFFRSSFELKDFSGVPYQVDFATTVDGFRIFGDTHTARPKVLFIGDSFTHAVHVSNDKTYYARVGAALDLEVFAYGVGGFSTCQELLVLEKSLPVVDPDIVVWQFCVNDFTDNHREFAARSTWSGTIEMRPFMRLDGSLYYGISRDADRIYQFANAYSRSLKFILSALHRLRSRPTLEPEAIEYRIARAGGNHPLYREAVKVTEKIFDRVKAAVGSRTLVAFSVGADPFYTSEIDGLFERVGIDTIDSVPIRLMEEGNRGKQIHAEDGGHWNELGHEICGREIERYLEERFSIPRRARSPAVTVAR